ncbi:hypothetical protein APICC_05379 [Apis cerana cerana]|uniref:Uncharacterized protein n=1 Tax=Apis cerana cerana TaxID=94128 RepID=A0A2A3E1H2_APICC|nr:hypothetical protein APICC_05379 [Apis cerana cerana]
MSAEYNLETSSDAWHMDSDATEHMSNRQLSFNLFLANAALADKGLRQYFDDKKCTFMKNGNIVAIEKRKDQRQANMAVYNSLFSWHKRMTYQNVDQVKKIQEYLF